jgi:hypothetical protein
VAIGYQAGYFSQQREAVAIGFQAGQTIQGTQCIAIGYQAGQTNQAANSIILNATGATLNSTTMNSFYVSPIRTVATPPSSNYLTYNDTNKEVTKNTTLGDYIVFNSAKLYLTPTDPALAPYSYTINPGDIWIDTIP